MGASDDVDAPAGPVEMVQPVTSITAPSAAATAATTTGTFERPTSPPRRLSTPRPIFMKTPLHNHNNHDTPAWRAPPRRRNPTGPPLAHLHDASPTTRPPTTCRTVE
ncbi:hypothetical protein RE0346_31860 [Prescottella equi]|nr:hypothetical protein RE0346_31860 [Prescottella equi]